MPAAADGEVLLVPDDVTAAHRLAVPSRSSPPPGSPARRSVAASATRTRAHGLSCDNLVPARVVLADRSQVTADHGADHRRLTEVARRYDPGNLLHLDQNAEPS